jgi:hypothetical protein
MMKRRRKNKASVRNERIKRTGMVVYYNTISSPELSAILMTAHKYIACAHYHVQSCGSDTISYYASSVPHDLSQAATAAEGRTIP